MAEPLLSIVTPSLNQGRYIAECLDSVAAEMATPIARRVGIEHIVMDGGSTDGTVEQLERASHLTYWQSAPAGGQSAAINRGLLDHARGRYATWLNADDWFEPGALAPMLERLSEDDAPDVLVGRCRFVENGQTIFSPRPPEPIDIASLLRLRTKWFAGQLIVQPEAFFDRERFAAVCGLNESNHYTMDHELWLRLLEAGASFESIDHPVACMRVHDEQKTANNRRIVESLIRFGQPVLERHAGDLGADGDAAGGEIRSLQRKLDLSEPVLRRLRCPWDARPGTQPQQESLPDAPVGFHLAPLRAILADVPSSRRLGRPYRARVVGHAPLEQLPLRLRIVEDDRADVLVLWHALSRTADPEAVMAEYAGSLRPGGLVIVGAELRENEAGLDEYTTGLAELVDQQLSQDHDWLIDAAAMPWVESLQTHTANDDARLLASHPNPFGIELDGMMATLGFERLASMAYGGPSWHPLTPFEAVEGVPGRAGDGWCCGVWRKP